MPASIPAFSIVLGHIGARFTPEQEEKRKRVVREEIKLLIPSSKYLLHSILEEHVEARGNQILLVYDLVEAPQLSFEFDSTDSSRSRVSPIIVRLIDDLRRLRDSAESTQIRILELAQMSVTLAEGIKDHHDNFAGDLAEDDSGLWKFIHLNGGKRRKIMFPDGDVIFQLPLFPKYLPEKFNRRIRASIESISENVAQLKYVMEVEEIRSTASQNANRPPIAKRNVPLHRSIDKDKEYLWPLLFSALKYRVQFEANVRVALHADSLKPGYMELHDLVNHEELMMKFDLMHNCIKQAKNTRV